MMHCALSGRFAALILALVLGTTAAVMSQAPTTRAAPPVNPQRTLLIVHSPALAASAKEWAAYRTRTGWTVELREIAATANPDADAQRQAIRQAIRSAHSHAAASDLSGFAVLLLGDDDALPAWHFDQTDPLVMDDDRQYISDQPYQFADDADEIPDFALGRVPARSDDDARALLRKIEANDAIAVAGNPASGRITYIAGEGHFGALDPLLETLFVMMVDRFVPDAFDLSMTYAKASSVYCPPPSHLTATVLERLTEGGVLFNYVGHGHERGLDSLYWNNKRLPILRTRDLQSLDAGSVSPMSQRPVAFMSCCSVGHFDLPAGDPSLSEALLFHPTGPVAIISGSRITHPYANTILQKDITHALLIERAPTAGMLDLLADRSLLKQDSDDRELDAIAGMIARQMKWTSSLKDLRVMHARMYNLLGDPATQIALADASVRNLVQADGVLRGESEGIVSGRVTLRIETLRTVIPKADKLIKVEGDSDPDLDRKAATNYPLANDRLLQELQGEMKDGRFEIALPNPLPAGTAVLRVRIEGVDSNGVARTSVGALRLQ